jgi:hypothetical protein
MLPVSMTHLVKGAVGGIDCPAVTETDREGATAMAIRNNRKHARWLRWTHTTGESVTVGAGVVFVGLTDIDEPDRRSTLKLSDEDAVRLAGILAHHTGYRLVERETVTA